MRHLSEKTIWPTRPVDTDPLSGDVHRLRMVNAQRAARGRRPLSYGQARVRGLLAEKEVFGPQLEFVMRNA